MGHVAGPQPLVPHRHLHPQVALGQLGGGGDQADHGRVEILQEAADVDRADLGAGVGVVDRGGRAAPGLVGTDQVLGRVDLDGSVDRQRGAHRVGANRVLGPAGALAQADRVGPQGHVGGSLPPQDRAVRVGDDHDVVRRVGDVDQHLAQQRDHRVERVGRAYVGHVVRGVDQRGPEVVGIDVGGQRPAPRLGDQRARWNPGPAFAQLGLVRLLQHQELFTGSVAKLSASRGRAGLPLICGLRCLRRRARALPLPAVL